MLFYLDEDQSDVIAALARRGGVDITSSRFAEELGSAAHYASWSAFYSIWR
jgi:hypothetical protein